ESLAFSPDDELLAAGCQDGSILLIDVNTLGRTIEEKDPLVRLQGRVGEGKNLLFDPVRKRLFASGSGARRREWCVPGGAEGGVRREAMDLTKMLLGSLEPTQAAGDALPDERLRNLLAMLNHLRSLHTPYSDERWTH